jgi:hypothetical protein
MYRTDCGTAHPVLLNWLSKGNTSCGPARQIFIYFCGAEGWGGIAYVLINILEYTDAAHLQHRSPDAVMIQLMF